MITLFPDNNLPYQSQDWADKVESEISRLKKQTVVQPTNGIDGAPGETVYFGNIDGGHAGSVYGGIPPLVCGDAGSF